MIPAPKPLILAAVFIGLAIGFFQSFWPAPVKANLTWRETDTPCSGYRGIRSIAMNSQQIAVVCDNNPTIIFVKDR